VLATGGYGANPQMSQEFEQLPGYAQDDSGLMPASLTGDGIVLGAEIGGVVHKVENSLRVMLSYTSRLPSFSHRTESIGEQLNFGEHRGKALDQGDQPLVWHRRDEIVKHAPLTEQRMSAAFGCI